MGAGGQKMVTWKHSQILRTIPCLIAVCLISLPAQAKYSGGTGEPNDPYQIATAADLIALGESPEDYGKHFLLTADIDPNLPGQKVFDKAVIAPDVNDIESGFQGIPFTGIFDGSGRRISHLTIRGGASLGLFGQLQARAEVRNLGLVDVNVIGSGSDGVGGLVAWNCGAVNQCYSTGVISGTQTSPWYGGGGVGGLVGYNVGTVTRCYSMGAVNGCDYVGGLVGKNAGTITDSYARGPVAGAGSAIGGLVGCNFNYPDMYSIRTGTISNCYSTGMVTNADQHSSVGGLVGHNHAGWVIEGSVTACFWDTQTSRQPTSEGGTGKGSAEMQTAKTFLQAGWDFVGETANSTDDTWGILEGKGYPALAWEFYALFPNPQYAATDVLQSPILSWRAATKAVGHDVYLGEDETLVANATRESPGVYRRRQATEKTTYDPGVLKWGKTYYWRVDEVNEVDPNSSWKGSVWSFTTADFIVVSVVDDFESYTDDEGSLIWETWVDGWYFDANHPGNGTRSSVGNVDPPFAEQTIVHAGWQSMPMDYNWDYNDVRPWYSEAERTWETPQDWTIGGADTLTLYFRGEPNNSPEPLYVGIEDSAGRVAAVVHPDAEAVLASDWQKWHIALGEVRAAGVDVAAVQKMVIGVGDHQNPKPGGTGRIYIDDIRLTKRMP